MIVRVLVAMRVEVWYGDGMAKYKKGNFLQIDRGCFEILKGSKTSSKWLYVVLNELEHRYTSMDIDYFYRSSSDIARESGLSRTTVIKGLEELRELKLIETWTDHIVFKSGKKATNKITYIRVASISGGQSGAGRRSKRYYNWRKRVLKRDNYTCQECGASGKDVLFHVHHIIQWGKDKAKRFKCDNGLTLCVACHVDKHPWMEEETPVAIRRRSW